MYKTSTDQLSKACKRLRLFQNKTAYYGTRSFKQNASGIGVLGAYLYTVYREAVMAPL
jgi:hypothetical protein